MNKKIAESIAILLVFLVGIAYTVTAVTMGDTQFNTSLPPGYYPTIVGAIWILLCIPAMVKVCREIKHCEDKFQIAGLPTLVKLLVGIIVYLLAWQYIGLFYVDTAIFLLYLFTICMEKEEKHSKKAWMINIALTLFVTFIIYLLFGALLHVKF